MDIFSFYEQEYDNMNEHRVTLNGIQEGQSAG